MRDPLNTELKYRQLTVLKLKFPFLLTEKLHHGDNFNLIENQQELEQTCFEIIRGYIQDDYPNWPEPVDLVARHGSFEEYYKYCASISLSEYESMSDAAKAKFAKPDALKADYDGALEYHEAYRVIKEYIETGVPSISAYHILREYEKGAIKEQRFANRP